jgi:hypothetical protein
VSPLGRSDNGALVSAQTLCLGHYGARVGLVEIKGLITFSP